ncbi:MAG: DMT family transporter [Alphaproteobacteria bacterium]|nr:DMT family transporter [Alphaproteobacteria bacterium]
MPATPAPSDGTRQKSILRTLMFAGAASAFFAAMHTGVRFTSTTGMHPFEIAFFRNLFGLVALAPFLIRTGPKAFRTERLGLHVVRGAFNGVSVLAWFSALALLPVAEATSLSLAGPIFVALGAMAFLGERVDTRRWIGIAVVLGGGLLIVRPGFAVISLGVWLVLIQTVALTGSKLLGKQLTRTEEPDSIVAYLTLMMTLATFVPALFVWTWPNWEQLGMLAVIGLLGTMAHRFLVRAYVLSDVSLVDPMMFLRMAWAALFGVLIFAEFPDGFTWAGAGVILAGTILITRRGARPGTVSGSG